jgi:hypothetical protein
LKKRVDRDFRHTQQILPTLPVPDTDLLDEPDYTRKARSTRE